MRTFTPYAELTGSGHHCGFQTVEAIRGEIHPLRRIPCLKHTLKVLTRKAKVLLGSGYGHCANTVNRKDKSGQVEAATPGERAKGDLAEALHKKLSATLPARMASRVEAALQNRKLVKR